MADENKIVSLRVGMRAVGILLVFLVGYGVGLYFNNNQLVSRNSSSSSVNNIPGNVVDNPIISGVNVDGVLKSKDKNSFVLEKDGNELKIFVEGNVDFVKIGDSSQKASGANLAKEKLDEVKTGTKLSGQVLFKKDPSTSEVKIVAVSFLIKP